MASLCNYSHPDPRLAQGLVEQGAGRLFPYNPEFYDNASGLYGPGAIYCWYMLLASVLASWSFYLADHGSLKERGLSSDLIGALAYPVFAATDLLLQSIRMRGVDHRALAILCIRFPKHGLVTLKLTCITFLLTNSTSDNVLSISLDRSQYATLLQHSYFSFTSYSVPTYVMRKTGNRYL
ncbi:hypothetical protein ACHAP5_003239 [Fusarium lateritium]